VRWTAVDANLSPRPIHIDFQRAGADAWRPVVPDAIANTGRFDWRLPDDLVGSVALRVSVTDQGGHRVDSEARRIETTPTTAVPPPSEPAPFSSTAPSAPPAALPGSVRSRKLAEQAYVEAVAFRRRGDLRRGVSRMRDVLRYDPQRTDVFAEMADMLYELNDLDRALNAYDLALRQDPTQRSALLGSARVLSRRRDYGPAAERLRTLLRYNPNDAAAWMGLGDVAVYQGDELLARECYTRATQIDPGANEVIRDARKRLAMMAEVSRSYHPSDR